jgi:amylosucrase
MVMLWSSLAAKESRLATQSLRRMAPIPTQTSWVTYARCHDDIGWAVSDTDAGAVGLGGFEHRRFLNDFYSGRFPFSFARGALFQENLATGDARISGSAASLCGIDDALDRSDDHALELGIRRLVLLYSVVFAYGGIPLIYMGDELALRNDVTYLDDPGLAADNRWMHRPWMDWSAAARRADPATLEGRVFGWIQRLGTVRKDLPALRTGGEFEVVAVDDSHLLAWRRRHPRSGDFVGLANFAETDQSVDIGPFHSLGRLETVLSSDGALDVRGGRAYLPGLGFAWLVEH